MGGSRLSFSLLPEQFIFVQSAPWKTLGIYVDLASPLVVNFNPSIRRFMKVPCTCRTRPRSLQRGLEAILGPSEDPLQGSLEAVILLAAHAFRLELTISVAALYHFEEFPTFAEAQPIFTQTLL